MNIINTDFDGVFIIELHPHSDERGFFARSYCAQIFQKHNLNTHWPQHNLSYNKQKGTLRGLHFQRVPYEEIKLVSCLSGAIFDVLVDLRPDSKTYLQWRAFELSAVNMRSLYIPVGFAHGFQSLENETRVMYLMGEFYQAGHAAGIDWADAQLQITWPIQDKIISQQDQNWPQLSSYLSLP